MYEITKKQAAILTAAVSKESTRYALNNVLSREVAENGDCEIVATNGRIMAIIKTNGVPNGQYKLVKNYLMPVPSDECGNFPKYEQILPKIEGVGCFEKIGYFHDDTKGLVGACTVRRIGIDFFQFEKLIKALARSGEIFDIYANSADRPVYVKSDNASAVFMPFNLETEQETESRKAAHQEEQEKLKAESEAASVAA